MKVKIHLIIGFIFLNLTNFFAQEEQVFTSIIKAKQNPAVVKHLAPTDFDPNKDGYILTDFPNLEILDLSKAQNVTIVPLGFKKLTSLKYLNISNTEIGLLYPYIKKLPQLKEVVAVNCALPPFEVKKIQKKTSIKVISETSNIPDVFKYEPNQETTLDNQKPITQIKPDNPKLDGNKLNTTSVKTKPSVSTQHQEEKLSYKVYSIKEVTEKYAHLVRNVYVSAFGGDLERLIEFIPKMTSLEKLRMGAQFSDFPSIPNEINQLHNLRFLEIVTKDEIDLPEITLSKLDTLVLPPMKNIPSWIKGLSLKSLTIYTRQNKMDWTAVQPKELTSLKFICDYAEVNSTSSVKAIDLNGIETCKHLEELEVELIRPEKKSIKVNTYSVPEGIGQLTQLKKLIFKGVKIDNDISSIGNLTQLEELYIKAKGIPASFRNLTHLKVFKNTHWLGEGIYNSPIKGLPNMIPFWTNLEELIVCPAEGGLDLTSLKNLQKVFIDFSQSIEVSEVSFLVDNKIEIVSLKFSKAGVNTWSLHSKSLKKMSLFCEDENNTLPKDLLNYKTSLEELKIYDTKDEINFTEKDFLKIKEFVVK